MTKTTVQTRSIGDGTSETYTRYVGRDGRRTYASRIVDRPPEFALIAKADLRIDHAYQRNLNDKRVQKMLAAWSWTACGALKVALRPDGEWYVFDGQHRLAAALKLPSITTMPCLIYEMETTIEEARGFLSQTDVKPMNTIDRFRAMVAAGNEHAIFVQRLLDESGVRLRLGVDPGSAAVACAGELLRWAETDPDALARVWPVLVDLQRAGGLITDRLLKAAVHAERRLEGGVSLAEPRWRKILVKVGHARIMDMIRLAVEMDGNASQQTCARGLIAAINHGRRTNRLVVRDITVVEEK